MNAYEWVLVASAGVGAVALITLMVAAYNDREAAVGWAGGVMILCNVVFWVTVALALVRLVTK
jgi:hypothetical protein